MKLKIQCILEIYQYGMSVRRVHPLTTAVVFHSHNTFQPPRQPLRCLQRSLCMNPRNNKAQFCLARWPTNECRAHLVYIHLLGSTIFFGFRNFVPSLAITYHEQQLVDCSRKLDHICKCNLCGYDPTMFFALMKCFPRRERRTSHAHKRHHTPGDITLRYQR